MVHPGLRDTWESMPENRPPWPTEEELEKAGVLNSEEEETEQEELEQ